MQIVMSRTDENEYFANIFNSHGVFMIRFPVDEEFTQLHVNEQYKKLKEKYPETMKRIR